MKRIIAVFLTLLLLLGSLSISAFAEETQKSKITPKLQEALDTMQDDDIQVVEPTDESKDLFKDLFAEKIGIPMSEIPFYNEEYYHYSKDTGEMDWVLIRGNSNIVLDWCVYESLGNIVLRDYNEGTPFSFGYCILDVSKLDFVSLENAYNNCSMYEDLEQIVDEMVGERIGDVDGDGSLSIFDATTLQKCLAKVIEFPREDEVEGRYGRLYGKPVYYISDINLDGERDIVDATAIQKCLAGLPYDNRTFVRVEFSSLYTVYSHNEVSAYASRGRAPYQYKFTIIGGVHAYSEYGEDFGDFKVDTSNPIPGQMKLTTGYIDSNSVLLPAKSITYGDVFTLIVTAKDANGEESKPVEVTFINADDGEPPTEECTGIYE